MGDTDKDWEKFGATDPYFWVITQSRFRAGCIDGPVRDAFFGTGQAHFDTCLSVIREELDPGFAPARALDFGCGVGRVTIPIARLASSVTAADVSESMLREARRNCDAAGLGNVELVRSDDDLTALAGPFDFIHSYIVFQHIPVTRGSRIFERLLARLAPGGVGAMHFTYRSPSPLWWRPFTRLRTLLPHFNGILNLIEGRAFREPHLQMNVYDTNELLHILHRHGCHRVRVRFSDHGGYLGVFLFFSKSGQATF